jgi:hypothetical protein
MELAVHASLQALGRVGLTPVDVDGLFIALPQDFLLAWGWPNTWAYARA